jgi:hypothetical protein
VASATAAGERLFDEFFVDHLHAYHVAADPTQQKADVAHTYYNRPDKQENILAPVEGQCGWLRDIGFVDVDCFFKVFELALFGGRKRARPAARSWAVGKQRVSREHDSTNASVPISRTDRSAE